MSVLSLESRRINGAKMLSGESKARMPTYSASPTKITRASVRLVAGIPPCG